MNKLPTQEELEKQVEKICSYKTWNQKKKSDALFELDCNLYTQLGFNSPQQEKDLVHKFSLIIYRQMKKCVDWTTGSAMLHSLGKLM